MKLFDGTYDSIGSSGTNLILKTKGKVKIQYGNKFIDLIKDGKINTSTNIIQEVESIDNIGTSNGIYVTSDGQVVIKVESQTIQLSDSTGTTYVSFQQEQQTTSEQKYIALKNIGLISPTQEDISISNGIVYVEDTKKLYIVSNEGIQEFSIDIPNPYPKQFIIAKETKDKGALVIQGDTSNNSISFNSCDLYTNNSSFYINSAGNIFFQINDKNVMQVSDSKVISNRFCSLNSTSTYGFDLYMENGQSYLRVDNLITTSQNAVEYVYPSYWYDKANVIETVENDSITLKYDFKYEIGDVLTVIASVTDQNLITTFNQIDVTVTGIDGKSLIISPNLSSAYIGKTIFKSSGTTLKQSGMNLDIISDNEIITRIGDLGELQKTQNINYGIYSKNAIFDNIQYSDDYQLADNDNSSKLASTEWVRKSISSSRISSIDISDIDTITTGSIYQVVDGTQTIGTLLISKSPNQIFQIFYTSRIQTNGSITTQYSTDTMFIHYRIYNDSSSSWSYWNTFNSTDGLFIDRSFDSQGYINYSIYPSGGGTNNTTDRIGVLTIPPVTTSNNGLMSYEDKIKLNNFSWNDLNNKPNISADGDDVAVSTNLSVTGQITASAFYENSDINIKENIQKIEDDNSISVNFYQFNFKNDSIKRYGVIAQELEKTGLSHLVNQHGSCKSVDYISLLIFEINRLNNRVQMLENKLNKMN